MLIEWLLELKDSIDKHGIRLGVVLTLFVMYRKELRNMRLDMRDEALFQNIKILMEERGLGAQWIGQPKVSHKDLMNYKQLQQSYSVAISRVGKKWRRRSKMMQFLTASISKKLIAFLITVAVTAANNKYGLNIDANEMYGLYAVMVAYIVGQAHVDAKKIVSNAVNNVATSITEAAATTDGSPITTITAMPMNIDQAKPYLVDVSRDIQELFNQIQSGKVTDSSRNALNVIMTIHEYIQKNKGA